MEETETQCYSRTIGELPEQQGVIDGEQIAPTPLEHSVMEQVTGTVEPPTPLLPLHREQSSTVTPEWTKVPSKQASKQPRISAFLNLAHPGELLPDRTTQHNQWCQ